MKVLRFFGSPNLNIGRNGFQTEKKYKLNFCCRFKKIHLFCFLKDKNKCI